MNNLRDEDETWLEAQRRWNSWRLLDLRDATRDTERARLAAEGKKFYTTPSGNQIPVYATDRSDDNVDRIIKRLSMGSWSKPDETFS